MSGKITPFHEPHSDDDRPLPERIADLYGFRLAPQDVKGVRYYPVQDWIAGILPQSVARNIWNMMKRRNPQLYTRCVQLPYVARDGKTYPNVDHANAETLYLITQRLQANSGNRDEILLYLAKAGVVLDELIRHPGEAEAIFADIADEKDYRQCLKDGMSHEEALQWVRSRRNLKEETKLSTSEWQSRGVTTKREYGRLNNDVSKTAVGKTATALKQAMQIDTTPRDYLSAADNAAMAITYTTSRILHGQRESNGVDELSEDIQDVKPIIDVARPEIEKVFSKKPRRLPKPR